MTEENSAQKKKNDVPEAEVQSSLSIEALMVTLLAIVAGVAAAAYVLPAWLPGLAGSFAGANAKAYWFMSRGSGFAAMGLLWLSMMLGVGITNKMARVWPGIPPANAIHEYVSLLGALFIAFHALILLGDSYSKYQLVQLLMPFGSVQYRPVWVGLGQLAFYVWLIIMLAFYMRKLLGKKTWRVIHYASFLCYLGALVHGLMSGTDTGSLFAQVFYWASGGSFLFLLVYRILTAGRRKPARPPVPAASPRPGREAAPAASQPLVKVENPDFSI